MGRRTLLRGIPASALIGGITETTRAVGHHELGVTEYADHGVQPSEGDGAICEIDVDEMFQTEMHLVTDPAKHGRKRVLHVTSNRNHTRDYACSVLTLIDRGLTLGEVIDNRMSFDYFEGRRNENAAPDEFFLVVQTKQGIFVTFQHRNTGGKLKWQTYDVSAAVQGAGPPWKKKEIPPKAFDIQGDINLGTIDLGEVDADLAMVIVHQIIEFLRSLRDRGKRIHSPAKTFGRDAQILAVATGKGFTTEETVNDIFYDELVFETDKKTTRLEWPVALSMRFQFLRQKVTPAADETVRARLAFEQPEQGLTIDEVDAESIVLTPYTSIAPLENVDGVEPESITRRGNQLRMTFDSGEIADVVDSPEPTLLLTGEFIEDALPRPVSFLGRATLRLGNTG